MKEINFLLNQLANRSTPNLPGTFEAEVWRKIHRSQPSSWLAWIWPQKLTPSFIALALLLVSLTTFLTHFNSNPSNNFAKTALDLTSFSSSPENLPSTLLLN